jgi:hypothetical protein
LLSIARFSFEYAAAASAAAAAAAAVRLPLWLLQDEKREQK